MRRIVVTVLLIMLTVLNYAATKTIEWTGSTQQKISGLMSVWSEAKYTFPGSNQHDLVGSGRR